jgi:hypothetical protein
VVNNLFKKFFGKKNDGFYVQLEDDDAKSTPAAKAPTKAAPASTPAPTVTAPTAAVAAAPAAAAPKAENKTAKTEKKSVKKAETPKVDPAPAPVAVAPAPVIKNFATDYLIKPSSNSGRRRPGANMRQFMDLARQMDKPKPFKATAAERKPAEKPTEPKSK